MRRVLCTLRRYTRLKCRYRPIARARVYRSDDDLQHKNYIDRCVIDNILFAGQRERLSRAVRIKGIRGSIIRIGETNC